VQTALAKTYVAWSRVRVDAGRGEHPDRYVHRVLIRAFVDLTRRPWWRRERGGRTPSEGDLDAGQATGSRLGTGSGATDPASPALDPDDVHAIRSALAALPPDQRAAVVLRHWLGHDVAETARLLCCPEATVRSRTFRGLARLRTLLGDLDAPPRDAALLADPTHGTLQGGAR
jgi:RNA polymerase sigma factor (sigma-70 family)